MLLLPHEQAAEKGLGEALGRDCTIQLNHHCHQCNERRSVLSTDRQGKGEREREWMGWRKKGGVGGNGESKDGGRRGWVVESGEAERKWERSR